jgi:hypothetical protein
MNTCTEHRDTVVVYQGSFCPLCDHVRMVREWEAEADRMGKENNDLCDKIFELQQELKKEKSQPDFLSQALNEGDGVYRP